MQIKVNINQELTKNLEALEKKLNNPKELYSQIGIYLLEVVEESFQNEASADGKKWEELKPSYLLQKRKKGYTKILQNKGRLAESIDYLADDNKVAIGTNLVYAPIHQLGGYAGKNKSSYIPARPYLPVEDGELYENIIEDILSLIKEYIKTE